MTNPKHTDTSRSGDLDHWECFCDASYYDMWCVREAGERRFGHGFHLVNGDEAHGLCDLLSKQADRIEALEAKVERLREALDKDAARFERCADMISDGSNPSGTLRVERFLQAKQYATEARAAMGDKQ